MFTFKEQNVYVYLVCNDDLLLNILSKNFKEKTDYNFVFFKTGEAFLHYFISHPIKKKSAMQVLLLDFDINKDNKKIKSGLEILKYINSISEKTETIALTYEIDNHLLQKINNLGIRANIKKNENAFIRIQNVIQWLVSELIIKEKERYFKVSLFVFLSLLVTVSGLAVLFEWFL